jgi:glycosyltransferase involved in cell wall biosynthesis
MAKVSLQASSRLRICHLAYTFYESDNRVIRYAREMASHGHQVDVIALRRNEQSSRDTSDGVRLMRIQRRSVTEKSAGAYLAKLVWFFGKATALLTGLHIRNRYDVVHVHNVPDFLVFAALIPRLAGARIILDIHDIMPELYLGKFGAGERSAAYKSLLTVEQAACSFADHVIVANDLWHETLTRRSAQRCTTLLNYPDISLFTPAPVSERKAGAPFIFLYPGSLNHHQGVDVAIRAFALAKNEMPNSEFHVYGEGPAKPLLGSLVRELAIEDRVKIRDRVSIAAIAEIMVAADVGVVPKRADGFGNEAFSTKILEFMASRVPVIVSKTRVDQHHFDSTLVRFFNSGDERDLAAAMIDTFVNRGEAQERAEAGLRFARSHSWQERGVEYRELVASLVAPSWSRSATVR